MSEVENQLGNEVSASVAANIIDGIEGVIRDARSATRPLEVEPFRARLFELFVTADGAGLISDDRTIPVDDDTPMDETDLSADGLCRSLARRTGLDMAARDSAAHQAKLASEQLEEMRLLWSVMRMWMEWSYAWRRWDEFHRSKSVK